MDKIIDNILEDWAYRVHDGMPDVKNPLHLVHLEETLNELKIPREVVKKVLEKVRKYADNSLNRKLNRVGEPWGSDAKDVSKRGGSADDIDQFTDDELGSIQKSQDTLGEKDKELDPNKDTSKDPAFADPKTGISDDEFKNQSEIKSNYENEEDVLTVDKIEKFFQSGKIPKKYAKVITRLMNSKKTSKAKITNFLSGVGAGELQAQAGEIITMASMAMGKDDFNQFIGILESQTAKYPKGSNPIVTQEWLNSVKSVRAISMKRYNKKYGEGNWSISNTAWDVPSEFEALGNSDYKGNKGFSTDMYVKLEVDGKPVLDEISLKKDSDANIYNGVVTDIEEWFGKGKVPNEANVKIYKEGELQRPTDYGKKSKPIELDIKKLISGAITTVEHKNLRTTLRSLGVIRKVKGTTNDWEIHPKNEKLLNKIASIKVPPPIDQKRFKEVTGSGAVDRYKKGMMIHAAVAAAHGDDNALDFLNKHVGYTTDEKTGKFPEGSIRRYQNDTIKSLVASDTAKEGLLKGLAEKLPLKSLFKGEEKIAIGGLSGDEDTLKDLFEVDDYEQFRTGLTMTSTEDGDNYLVYSSKGPPAKEVKIATVQVRQKGLGYASSVGLEFTIAKEFAKELYESNEERYGEPPITAKEKKNLGIK